MFGKWHLGMFQTKYTPIARGFDQGETQLGWSLGLKGAISTFPSVSATSESPCEPCGRPPLARCAGFGAVRVAVRRCRLREDPSGGPLDALRRRGTRLRLAAARHGTGLVTADGDIAARSEHRCHLWPRRSSLRDDDRPGGLSRPGGRVRGGCHASGPIRRFTRASPTRQSGRHREWILRRSGSTTTPTRQMSAGAGKGST